MSHPKQWTGGWLVFCTTLLCFCLVSILHDSSSTRRCRNSNVLIIWPSLLPAADSFSINVCRSILKHNWYNKIQSDACSSKKYPHSALYAVFIAQPRGESAIKINGRILSEIDLLSFYDLSCSVGEFAVNWVTRFGPMHSTLNCIQWETGGDTHLLLGRLLWSRLLLCWIYSWFS